MKKFTIFACVMVIGAGAAIAASVNIPFYAEFGATDAFVGVQNVGAEAQTLSVTYFYAASTGGQFGGSFVLAPGESVSFQPFKATSNEVQPVGVSESNSEAGSILIETSGGTTEVVGRYVQLTTTTAFAHNVSIT